MCTKYYNRHNLQGHNFRLKKRDKKEIKKSNLGRFQKARDLK